MEGRVSVLNFELRQPSGTAEQHDLTTDLSLQAKTRFRMHTIRRRIERNRLLLRDRHDGSRERVVRAGRNRRRDAQQLGARDAIPRQHLDDLWPAFGQRPGLVEQRDLQRRSSFEGGSVLEEHTQFRPCPSRP